MTNKNVNFENGAHCDATWAKNYYQPVFDSGELPVYQDADFYSVCYGDLCAYKKGETVYENGLAYSGDELLAVYSVIDLPNCDDDLKECIPTTLQDKIKGGEWETEVGS